MTGNPVCSGDPVGGAVPGAGLVAGDGGVGHQVHVGPEDPGDVAVEDDRAVHLRELAQAGRGERDVEGEAAGGDRLDGLVVAEHDQGAGAAAQDALQAVAQGGTRARCWRRRGAAGARASCASSVGYHGRGVSLGDSDAPSCARSTRQVTTSAALSAPRGRPSAQPSTRSADAMSARRRPAGRPSRGCPPCRGALGRHEPPSGNPVRPPRRAAERGRGPGAARRTARARRPPPPGGPAASPRSGRRDRERDRPGRCRLGQPGAADAGDVDVVAVQPDAGVRWRTARIIATRDGVDARRSSGAAARPRGGHQRLHLG